MSPKFRRIWLAPVGLVLVIGIYFVPPVHDRLAWRVDDLRTEVKYFFDPPAAAEFVPGQQAAIDAIVKSTMQAYSLAQTPTATPAGAATEEAGTAVPTMTPTPLPSSVSLPGIKYEDQFNRWNYCGPANFSMALTFWGWTGNRDVIGKAVKPSDQDKNVMPYEFQDFISANVPNMTSVLRYGGDIQTIKRLVGAGFPVVAEKGEYQRDISGKVSWMGHYQFITGYDDATQTLLIQDTYLDGPNFHMAYDKFMQDWRSFDYVFVVVYPTARDADVMALLGPYADATWATKHALQVATADSQSLSGIQQFFAWFDIGTSHVELQEYVDAANAYDKAFQVYATLAPDYGTRPWRMMWYQTGPYKAYYYSQRYQDVINLATLTLTTLISQPVLEESLLWRGRAEAATGSPQAAMDDYRASLVVHPGWTVALQAMQELGTTP